MATSRVFAENPGAAMSSTPSGFSQDVANLQKQLNAQGITDNNGKPLVVDGIMGPLTQSAIQKQQGAAQYNPQAIDALVKQAEAQRSGGGMGGMPQVSSVPRPSAFQPAQFTPSTPTIDWGSLMQRAQTVVNPKFDSLFRSLTQQAPRLQEQATQQKQGIESAYSQAQTGVQNEAARLADTVTGNMGRQGLFGSGINKQELIDASARYGLPQRIAQIEQERASALSTVDRETALRNQEIEQALQNLEQDRASAMAAELIRLQDAERQYGLQQSNMDWQRYLGTQQLGMSAANQAMGQYNTDIDTLLRQYQLENSLGQQEIDNMYRLAGLTGRIPEGLPGAGGLTADERFRQAQLARMNQPKQVDYMDNLLQSALENVRSGRPLDPAQKAAYDRWARPDDASGESQAVLASIVKATIEKVNTTKTPQQIQQARAEAVRDLDAYLTSGFLSQADYQKAMQVINMYFPTATGVNAPTMDASTQQILNALLQGGSGSGMDYNLR